jgi:hypothetical protein
VVLRGGVVVDVELELVVGVGHGHDGLREAGVLEHVGECFLDDAIGGDVEAARQGARGGSVDAQHDGQAGAAHAGDEGVDARQARPCGAGARTFEVGIEQVEQAGEFRQRGPAGDLHGMDGLPAGWRIQGDDLFGGAGLEDHQADAVRDAVVQFARDAGAFLEHR